MKISRYTITTNKISRDMRIACVADLHGHNPEKAISTLQAMRPDVIMMPGDIMEISVDYMSERNDNAIKFFVEASQIAPCFYCFGNHELYYSHAKFSQSKISDNDMLQENIEKIKECGIHILNDEYLDFSSYISDNTSNILLVGGAVCGMDKLTGDKNRGPNIDFLKKYSKEQGFKILMCHYPHYYNKYLKDKDFDLILSGHAHGGQWRIFDMGIYAPHQGLFPKYTSGIHNNTLVISRGASNNSKPIPRFFNPVEIVEIKIVSTT